MSKPAESLSEEEQQELTHFEAGLQRFVGAEAGPFLGWDTVNKAMIRHWCESMGDKNPAYFDPAAAANLGAPEGAVVAPATMMQAWTMTGFAGEHSPGSDTREGMPVLPLFSEQGYIAVVATNCEQEYFLPICEGDDIQHSSVIESISGRKTTGLGTGYFVTQLSEFKNQRDEVVGTMRFRVLKYKPAAR